MVDPKVWIQENIDLVFLGVVGFMLLLFLLFLINTVRMKKVQKRYKTLMKGLQHPNLEELLYRYAHDVRELENKVRDVLAQQEKVLQDIYLSAGPVGVVRYNAFPDLGSDLSYSVAMLNRAGDGVVMSSIFGREESRTYAKPVVAGTSTYPLSEEEKEAIQKALQGMK